MSEDETGPVPTRPSRSTALRILTALAIAAVFSCCLYLLVQALRPDDGVVSFAFLLILPAAATAFVCWIGDPDGERRFRWYAGMAALLTAAVLGGAVFVLREGAVCVVMLFPIWFLSGLTGASLVHAYRPRRPRADLFSSAFLLVPLAIMLVEPAVPLPTSEIMVSRSTVIAVPAERLWPMLRGFARIGPDEGRWNITHDLLGVPRPRSAHMIGEGVGADRLAQWGTQIRFREHVTAWEHDRRLAWRFIFDDLSGWAFTDQHLRPDTAYFRVDTGEYRLERLGPSSTRLTLETRYRVRTPINEYARVWGELILGDVEENVLELVRSRAEAARP